MFDPRERREQPWPQTPGELDKQHHIPSRLIIDGQQRLTSLYAVLRGRKVIDAEYRERQIEIAFRPRDGKFEVCDAAIRKDPEWIPNISDIWSGSGGSYFVIRDFLQNLSSRVFLSKEEEHEISRNIDRLFDIQKYPFTSLEIAPTVDEEEVADIFVDLDNNVKYLLKIRKK